MPADCHTCWRGRILWAVVVNLKASRNPLPTAISMITLYLGYGRFHIGPRSLFALAAVVAVYFAIACNVGYIEASGTVAAVLFTVFALRWRRRGILLLVRILIGATAAALLWLVAVDLSWFRDRCEDCWLDRDIWQVRVYGMPVYERTREHGILHRVAEDLGVRCPHQHSSHDYLRRYWGLVYPAYPCFNGILRLSGEDWYDDAAAEIVRARGKSSPALAEEFRQKVLVAHDWQYLANFRAKLQQSQSGNTTQPQPPPTAKPGGR